MNDYILSLKGINKSYKTKLEEIHIMRSLNFDLKRGEFVSILGRSGSGKSTLLNLMGLLDRKYSGNIYFDGKNVDKMSQKEIDVLKNRKIGFVFQFHYLLNEFTALENVMLPALLKETENDVKERAIELLKTVGLENRINHRPFELSGGEKQRVAIARALINKPLLILADEPTGNLDEDNSSMIFNLFGEINKKYGQSIVVVTHAKDLANISDRQLHLTKGVLISESLFSDNSIEKI